MTFYFHPQLDQRKERRKEAFFFFPTLSFMLSLQSIDSPPTLSVGRIHSSLAVSERQPWSHRLPRSSAFHLSTHSLEITRLILYKLRASSVLKTTGALTTITLPLGNSCKSLRSLERSFFFLSFWSPPPLWLYFSGHFGC